VTPAIRGALSRAAARVAGWHFAKPVARVALGAAGLVLLALIGRTAVAGAVGASPGDLATPALAQAATSAAAPSVAPEPLPLAAAAAGSSTATPIASRVPASAEDPVVLNTATAEDLRRLPGVGDKRANAILALRARLGRFRAIEDLLKVKGIGRATLKRLRPLVRLDAAAASVDAGAATPPPNEAPR
jgi:competence protein ComEA